MLSKTELVLLVLGACGGRKGRHKPGEYFATPEAVMDLYRYRTHLFGFIEASCGKSGALPPLQMAAWSALLAGISTATIGLELEYAADRDELRAHENMLRPAGAAVMVAGTVIVMGMTAWRGRANARFRAYVRRLTGGLCA